jgi:hypothetical protein
MESAAQAAFPRSRVESVAAIPWYLITMLIGSTSIVIGIIWDLSWHMVIGRDTFWSPPHVAVYFGGALAGFSCGALALKTTFFGTEDERAITVGFWGFRAPLGAWVAIWGALAMMVSAPFDNWWHNSYGLDIDKFTPPHALLSLGILTIQLGALFIALAAQNRATGESARKLGIVHMYGAGILLVMFIPVHIMEPNRRHTGSFYELMAAYLPIMLVAVARSSRVRWAATIASASYMLIIASMVWILPLFPAEAKLGPILNNIDHMVAPEFPLFLVFPALVVDLLIQRKKDKRAGWLDAVLIGIGFFVVFLVVHWYTAEFLLSPAARNWFFGEHRYLSFAVPPPTELNYRLWGLDPLTPSRFFVSVLLAIGATRVGLWFGQWMSGVQR